MEEQTAQDKILLTVSESGTTPGQYIVQVAQGSSVAETAFCITVVIKCLLRDGYVKSAQEVIDLVNTYMSDEEWTETEEQK